MSAPEPVVLGGIGAPQTSMPWLQAEYLAPEHLAAAHPSEIVESGSALAVHLADVLPLPGEGRTVELWEALATLGAADLTVARVVEPHLDAAAILQQAGVDESRRPQGLLGVYAAEGPGHRLTAVVGQEPHEPWRLTGSKPWCSLAQDVDGCLVTAFVNDSDRALFLVDMGEDPPPTVLPGRWVSRGLSAVESPALTFETVPAIPVGGPGWYLRRPGFAWGGMGVAAIWHGGAVGLARRLYAQGRQRELDQIGQMHLGRVDAALHRSRAVLEEAARLIDEGTATGTDGAVLALRVRQIVRSAAEEVLEVAAHAMGPGPLTGDEVHARRVADLQVYIRQEHAERDQAALGRIIDAQERPPW